MHVVMRSPVLLCLRALGLGDLLTALPALRAVAHAFPGHRRVLIAPERLAPLARLSSTVDDVIDAGPLARLPAPVEPEVAVNLHGRGPHSHRVLLALRPRRLIAFANAAIPESWNGPRWCDDEHEVHRWCRLRNESGIAADRPWHRALWAGRRGCHDADVPDPGLLSIGVRHVLQALATLPRRPEPLRVAS